jgi:hypothetical protein
MVNTQNRHDEELNRMYDILATCEPGTDEYERVLNEIMKAKEGEAEILKIEDARKEAKIDTKIKVGIFIAGLIVTPVIDTLCKRSLAKFIGTVEQMETFTSTPGRSMSSWFKWKQ